MEINELHNLGWRFLSRERGYLKFEGFLEQGERHGLGFVMLYRPTNHWVLIYEKDPAEANLTRFCGFIEDIKDLLTLHKLIRLK